MRHVGQSRDPERIGHFRIVGRLGQGGMGIVYRAEDERLRRTVALKVLPEAFAQDEERRKRFLREARSAGALTHANIATVHDVAEVDGRIYIAMELVEGESLRDRMARGALAPAEALRIARGIARGLARAHAKGIVHRDLKPDNVMLDAEGEPKILDFGLAKLREEEPSLSPSAIETGETASQLTREGNLLGTPQYMSPEQAAGAPADARSDVFAVGVMLYEMLSGRRPFEAQRVGELLAQIRRDSPAPLGRVAPQVPRELAAIVDRCLAKKRADRYADAQALSDALATVAPSRSRRPLALAAVVAAVLAGAVVVRATWPARATSTAPATTASTHAITMLDLPLPKSDVAAALTAYKEGLQATHDGVMGESNAAFERAVQLDSTMGAAWLRLLRNVWPQEPPTVAREYYRKAAQNRARLDERDARILEALEPVAMGDPPDYAQAAARLGKLSASSPDDADLLGLLAETRLSALDYGAADEAADRQLALDPTDARAWARRGVIRIQLGNRGGGVALIEHGLTSFGGCTVCMQMLAWLAATEGDCPRVEELGRRMARAEPLGTWGYEYVGMAMAGAGRPRELVLETLRQGWAQVPPGPREKLTAEDTMQLDLLYGDFDAAVRDIAAFERLEANDADELYHGELALVRLRLAEEAGDAARAGAVAKDFLTRRDAWARQALFDEYPVIHDPVPTMLGAEARAGLLGADDVEAGRARWIDTWRAKTPEKKGGFLWLHGWALPASTADEARAALEARAQYAPLPAPVRFTWVGPTFEAHVGKLLLLAGRPTEAVETLARGASTCDALIFPADNVRAHLWLGQAREATGDKAGACAAYGAVIARWGAVASRSVTARTAIARATALACPK
jgi:serine/threonine-protein kinase